MNTEKINKETELETKEEEVKDETVVVDVDSTNIEEKIKEKEKEWQAKAEAETNRRVNQVVDKLRKEQKEKDRIASLEGEEKIKEIERIKQEELNAREKELDLKTAKIDILENLKTADLLDAQDVFKPENYTGENIGNLAKDIETLSNFINAKVEAGTKEIRERALAGGATQPGISTSTTDITKEEFAKLSYSKKLDLYNVNPALYKSLN